VVKTSQGQYLTIEKKNVEKLVGVAPE